MRRYLLFISFSAVFLFSCSSARENSALTTEPVIPSDETLSHVESDTDTTTAIVEEIGKGISKLPNKRVAVVNFTDINGEETEEGKLLAEQITTKLSTMDDVKVIERQQFNKIIDEQKLNMAGFTTDTEQELGTILDVDAIISGTIAHVEDYVEINARMIGVKTGEIYSAVSTRRQLKARKRELEQLPTQEREKITREFRERETLKKRSPELYAITEAHKKELLRLKRDDRESFYKVVRTISILEKVKRDNPRIFLLITSPKGSLQLKKLKRQNRDAYRRVMTLRKELKYIIDHSPAYKRKIRFDRRNIIARLRQ